jgi:hypothetical protein
MGPCGEEGVTYLGQTSCSVGTPTLRLRRLGERLLLDVSFLLTEVFGKASSDRTWLAYSGGAVVCCVVETV